MLRSITRFREGDLAVRPAEDPSSFLSNVKVFPQAILDYAYMNSDFDHRACPICARVMRLAYVEPRRTAFEDGYERHEYRCVECENVSRFVFEVPSRREAA